MIQTGLISGPPQASRGSFGSIEPAWCRNILVVPVEKHKGAASSVSRDVRSKALRTVKVEEGVKSVRPYLAGFIARGPAITDAILRDLIQTQEKLAWNYGRKRKSVSIGIYRSSSIQWPVHYKGVDPDTTAFVPLQETRTMTLREILAEHPKGIEYASILQNEKVHPLLVDDGANVLSYPPIINSQIWGCPSLAFRALHRSDRYRLPQCGAYCFDNGLRS